jgi:peptidoglycan/LPS O-acetylase OafA/YrhL
MGQEERSAVNSRSPFKEHQASKTFIMHRESIDFSRRIPELDGLRGLAILLVLFYHYVESSPVLPRFLSAAGRLSWSGVDLFFVLSGFLIGGILLKARESPTYFKAFYVRRAYRILPIYAATVAAFWLIRALSQVDYSDNVSLQWLFSRPFPWYFYVTFTQNFSMTYYGNLGPAWLGATWSLAVEEQFYLTLPFIIKYVKPRRLPYLLGIVILFAPVFRTLLRLFVAHGEVGTYVLTPSRADALMLGVLAAFFLRTANGSQVLVAGKKLLYVAQAILFCGMLWMSLKPGALPDSQVTEAARLGSSVANAEAISAWQTVCLYARTALSSLNYTWIALFYLSILLLAITQRQSLLARAMRNPALMSIGAIAYGTFLFHEPVLGLCYALTRGTLPVITDFTTLLVTFCSLLLTLGLAKLSWVYFEKPLVGMGHRYAYRSPRKLVAGGQAPEQSQGIGVLESCR